MKQGWIEKTLGDACEIYQPKTIAAKEMVEDGLYPVFGANGIIGRYNKYNHEAAQLLITVAEPRVEPSTFLSHVGYASRTFMGFLWSARFENGTRCVPYWTLGLVGLIG